MFGLKSKKTTPTETNQNQEPEKETGSRIPPNEEDLIPEENKALAKALDMKAFTPKAMAYVRLLLEERFSESHVEAILHTWNEDTQTKIAKDLDKLLSSSKGKDWAQKDDGYLENFGTEIDCDLENEVFYDEITGSYALIPDEKRRDAIAKGLEIDKTVDDLFHAFYSSMIADPLAKAVKEQLSYDKIREHLGTAHKELGKFFKKEIEKGVKEAKEKGKDFSDPSNIFISGMGEIVDEAIKLSELWMEQEWGKRFIQHVSNGAKLSAPYVAAAALPALAIAGITVALIDHYKEDSTILKDLWEKAKDYKYGEIEQDFDLGKSGWNLKAGTIIPALSDLKFEGASMTLSNKESKTEIAASVKNVKDETKNEDTGEITKTTRDQAASLSVAKGNTKVSADATRKTSEDKNSESETVGGKLGVNVGDQKFNTAYSQGEVKNAETGEVTKTTKDGSASMTIAAGKTKVVASAEHKQSEEENKSSATNGGKLAVTVGNHTVEGAYSQTDKEADGESDTSRKASLAYKLGGKDFSMNLGSTVEETDDKLIFQLDSGFKAQIEGTSLEFGSQLKSNNTGKVNLKIKGKEYEVTGAIDWDRSTVSVSKDVFDKLPDNQGFEENGEFFKKNSNFNISAGFLTDRFKLTTKHSFDTYKNNYSGEITASQKDIWDMSAALKITEGVVQSGYVKNAFFFDNDVFKKLSLEAAYDFQKEGIPTWAFGAAVQYSAGSVLVDHSLGVDFRNKYFNGVDLGTSVKFPLNGTNLMPVLAMNIGTHRLPDTPGYQTSASVGVGVSTGNFEVTFNAGINANSPMAGGGKSAMLNFTFKKDLFGGGKTKVGSHRF